MRGERQAGRRTFPGVGMAALLIVAAGAILVDPGAAQGQSFPPPLVEGPAPDLDLVFTAQVIGWVEPCG